MGPRNYAYHHPSGAPIAKGEGEDAAGLSSVQSTRSFSFFNEMTGCHGRKSRVLMREESTKGSCQAWKSFSKNFFINLKIWDGVMAISLHLLHLFHVWRLSWKVWQATLMSCFFVSFDAVLLNLIFY